MQDSVCKYVAPCPEAWQPVRLHHLLSHTAGVPNFTAFPDYKKTMRELTTVEATIGRFRALPLDFKPGMVQATGQGKTEIFPASETNFFPRVVRADITFVKDAAGRVTHLVLNQNGRQQDAKKIN